ncbi:phthiocerol/phthiodiolone dimycocerosyl transferase family protein [Anthocerotibacter panamensis]|uniref:phthiocerol/phthiodiolone dimycocerosyl transferase family protein n=1 Tax=Anthocerotibacter panamensis TaxID=2857077 RepID=UPI001C40651E|nr:condensation domain-containing protein [Anthocerotibacter panamensis]
MSVSRRLGRVEEGLELLNRRAKTWNIVTMSRIQGPLTGKILRHALELAQHRHPALNTRIVGTPGRLYFEAGNAHLSLRVVPATEPQQWLEVVHEELNQGLDPQTGLLRAVLVQMAQTTSYLITTVHHAIADARCCLQLHAQLLIYSEQIWSTAPLPAISSLPALPPIEELMPPELRGPDRLLRKARFLLKNGLQMLRYRPQSLGFEQYAPIPQRRCGMVQRSLDPEFTQRIVQRCRQEGATVQGALCAAMMFTVAERIKSGKHMAVRLSCQSYLDLRQQLTLSSEPMAVLASACRGYYTLEPEVSLWELARRVKHDLASGLKHSDLYDNMLLSKELFEFCFTFPRSVPIAVSVSNLGRVTLPEHYGPFTLEAISFAGSNTLYAGMYGTNVTTFQGQMILNFIYSQPSVSAGTMEQLIDHTLAQLAHATQPTELTAIAPP